MLLCKVRDQLSLGILNVQTCDNPMRIGHGVFGNVAVFGDFSVVFLRDCVLFHVQTIMSA